MGTSLLLEFYNDLPEPREVGNSQAQVARLQSALKKFKRKVRDRYTEGTLLRLLESPDVQTRRAAVLAIGLTGTMISNQPMAQRLHDDDPAVRQMVADALWNLWFRADSEANNKELQRLMRLRDRDRAIAELGELIQRSPGFAEAHNQRAILYYCKKDYSRSLTDCEKTVQLNPLHFAAYAGMAQCCLHMNKPRAALKAFRRALEINPAMDEVEEAIRTLESALGGEEKK